MLPSILHLLPDPLLSVALVQAAAEWLTLHCGLVGAANATRTNM